MYLRCMDYKLACTVDTSTRNVLLVSWDLWDLSLMKIGLLVNPLALIEPDGMLFNIIHPSHLRYPKAE